MEHTLTLIDTLLDASSYREHAQVPEFWDELEMVLSDLQGLKSIVY